MILYSIIVNTPNIVEVMMRKTGRATDFQFKNYQRRLMAVLLANSKTEKEAESIVNIIFSNSEKNDIAQRFSIIKLFFENRKYYEIESSLGTTPGTVSKALDILVKNEDDKKLFLKVFQRCKFPEFKYQQISKPKKKNGLSSKFRHPGGIPL